MWISSGHPGSRHDFDIYQRNLPKWLDRLKKTPEELHRSNLEHQYWAQMADKGYVGANNLPGVIMVHPHKKMSGKHLSPTQRQENRDIGADRIVCENFYGRLKTLSTVMRQRWTCDRERYPTTFGNCVALTNHHILMGNPLRAEEQTWYLKHLEALKNAAKEKMEARKQHQITYQRKRQRRLGIFSAAYSPPSASPSSSSASSSSSPAPSSRSFSPRSEEV